MKDRKLTVIGDADPVEVANLLRKKFKCANLVSARPVPPPKAPEKPKEEKKEEKKAEEKKEEKKVEEKKEKKPEEKKEEKKAEETKEGKKEEKKKEEAVTKTIVISPQPMWYPMCEGQCYPPCLACPNRYPQYYKPCSPSEGFYIWKEESPRDICRIM